MALRYFFGTLSANWMNEHLRTRRESGSCFCFDTQSPADFVIGQQDTWDTVRAKFPDGWNPDAIVLNVQYRYIPAVIWSAPLPVIALAGDWNLQCHGYRRLLPYADLVLTDTAGVEILQRQGIPHARAMNLFGLGQSWLEFPWPNAQRDIDILFVGNMHPAVQRERLPWLARLAALRPQWNVVITSGVFDDDYRRLLARSRIVFNRSICGECNSQVGGAIAAGAPLFQEAGNREVPQLLRDREERVLYDDGNLELLLNHYLRCEDERSTIAANARKRLAEFTFSAQWEAQLPLIAEQLPELRQRAEKRRSEFPSLDVATRTWIQLSRSFGSDPCLKQDVTQALQERPRDAHLHNLMGILVSQAKTPQELPAALSAAAHSFQEAWRSDPRHVVAGLNLAG